MSEGSVGVHGTVRILISIYKAQRMFKRIKNEKKFDSGFSY